MAEATELLEGKPTKTVSKKSSTTKGEYNHENLVSLVKAGSLYGVRNTSDTPLIVDWDRLLMPEDLEEKLDTYLAEKYIQYNLSENTNNMGITTIFIEGKSVNFLEAFMNEKEVPTLVPMQVGKNVVIKSQFVIRPKEEVICTQKQLESLAKFEKVKRQFGTNDDSKYSDWLGFLIFRKLDEDSLKEIERSFVFYSDLVETRTPVEQSLKDRTSVKESAIIRATS